MLRDGRRHCKDPFCFHINIATWACQKVGIYPKTRKNRPGMGKTVGTGPPVRTQQQRVATNVALQRNGGLVCWENHRTQNGGFSSPCFITGG